MYSLSRSVRNVPQSCHDKTVGDEAVEQCLLKLFTDFYESGNYGQVGYEAMMKQQYGNEDTARRHLAIMASSLGYSITRKPSTLPTGGTGVFVHSAGVPQGSVVALYPGN